MVDATELELARAAFERGAWSEARARLTAIGERGPLAPPDLDRLATAAYLLGDDAASDAARARAHSGFLEQGDAVRAARSAYWLAFALSDRAGQQAQASGWLARAQRLLEGVPGPCAERGFLLCAVARQRAAEGDFAGTHAHCVEAARIALACGDRDLLALARHGEGRSLLMLGRRAEGLALLDEVMLAVCGGEVAPMVAGVVYCSVLSACHALFDLRRAQEWTAALQRWCDAHPEIAPFRGHCLVRRAELMQLHGAWPEALAEARRACEQLAGTARPERGAAHYQLAELHRLRGELELADAAYRLASQEGLRPQPGLSLLRLAQGQPEAAEASLRLALKETREPRARVAVLVAAVEILLARRDPAGAGAAAEELSRLAESLEAPFVRAAAQQARGEVALGDGRPLEALEALRAAIAAWQEVDAPHQAARARVRAGLACRQLGDEEGAQLELDAAQAAFEALGAAPDLARATELRRPAGAAVPAGLTGRELEVLRQVATGASNRAIAGRLGISEKTVARHVSSILLKLDLPSRAAATAFAYEHELL